jgi:iron(III) transport system ATP-binding protein
MLSGEAEMAVRPHSLALAAMPEDSHHLWLEGTITEREFLGEFVRYVVNVRDVALTADQTHHVGHAVHEPGAQVHVGVDTTQVRLLPL